MPTRRQERISEFLKEEISQVILHKLSDPRLGFVTVTKVETAPDIKSAKVYVSVMGDDAAIRRTMRALKDSKGYIQAEVASKLSTRYSPVLSFYLDSSLKQSLHISQLLSEAREEDGERNSDQPED
ncbi:MAG: ribosome-binding factor A [Planctomycetes bacterium DG_23]|nr:MAG: ribosome-binding factor A [Planctomycetes bacterium DG_23]